MLLLCVMIDYAFPHLDWWSSSHFSLKGMVECVTRQHDGKKHMTLNDCYEVGGWRIKRCHVYRTNLEPFFGKASSTNRIRAKFIMLSNYRDGKFAELTELLLIEYSLLYIPFLLSAFLTREKHQTRNTLFLICENELYSTLRLPHPLFPLFFMSSTSTDAFFEVLNSLLVFSFNLSQEIDNILFVEQRRWMYVFARIEECLQHIYYRWER